MAKLGNLKGATGATGSQGIQGVTGAAGPGVTSGTFANRPAANAVTSESIYLANDIGVQYYTDGTTWKQLSPGMAATLATNTTGSAITPTATAFMAINIPKSSLMAPGTVIEMVSQGLYTCTNSGTMGLNCNNIIAANAGPGLHTALGYNVTVRIMWTALGTMEATILLFMAQNNSGTSSVGLASGGTATLGATAADNFNVAIAVQYSASTGINFTPHFNSARYISVAV